MKDASRSMTVARLMAIVLGATAATAVLSPTVHAADGSSAPVPSTEGWLVKSYGQIEVPAASKSSRSELAELKAIVAKRTADDIARFRCGGRREDRPIAGMKSFWRSYKTIS